MEWVLALHEGDGDDAGARWPSASVGWAEGVGAVGVEFGWDERPLLGYVNLFTTLRTISSNGSDVKTPPCTYRARLSDQGPLTVGSGR